MLSGSFGAAPPLREFSGRAVAEGSCCGTDLPTALGLACRDGAACMLTAPCGRWAAICSVSPRSPAAIRPRVNECSAAADEAGRGRGDKLICGNSPYSMDTFRQQRQRTLINAALTVWESSPISARRGSHAHGPALAPLVRGLHLSAEAMR